MHIRNSKQRARFQPNNKAQTTAVTMQFPVSSGQQHRMTERWVPPEPIGLSSNLSKRLSAIRYSQKNPIDSNTIKKMYNSQFDMCSWATPRLLPGQFTGSTGANILKPNELNSGPNIWTRKDHFKATKPVTSGRGMHLLQKLGWRPGEGLGREKNGSLQPLLFDVKLDKRGLVAREDCPVMKRVPVNQSAQSAQNAQTLQPNFEEKHPVCLLNELAVKRKWKPPLYTMVNEQGPSHSKVFLFSVQVNGKTFTPDKTCNTKKEARMIAAKNCLQRIGIL